MRTGLLALCALAIAALFGVSSCSDEPKPPRVAGAERAAAVDAALAKTPVPRRYKIDGSDLVVVDVPSKEAYTGTLEFQRCFVWRDAEYKTATLSCPRDAEEAAPTFTPDTPGNTERL